jgi:hypothetical protein
MVGQKVVKRLEMAHIPEPQPPAQKTWPNQTETSRKWHPKNRGLRALCHSETTPAIGEKVRQPTRIESTCRIGSEGAPREGRRSFRCYPKVDAFRELNKEMDAPQDDETYSPELVE